MGWYYGWHIVCNKKYNALILGVNDASSTNLVYDHLVHLTV